MNSIIKSAYCHNGSYSAYTNQLGETIFSLHTLLAIKLISILAGKLEKEIKRAEYLKEGVTLRSVAKTLGHQPETNDLYNSVLVEALNVIKTHLEITSLGAVRINFLVGSTKQYPQDLHIYARLAGTTIEWVDEV
jgi:hypothetical protein